MGAAARSCPRGVGWTEIGRVALVERKMERQVSCAHQAALGKPCSPRRRPRAFGMISSCTLEDLLPRDDVALRIRSTSAAGRAMGLWALTTELMRTERPPTLLMADGGDRRASADVTQGAPFLSAGFSAAASRSAESHAPLSSTAGLEPQLPIAAAWIHSWRLGRQPSTQSNRTNVVVLTCVRQPCLLATRLGRRPAAGANMLA
jgi:hypothetical protein